jgi:S-formylglutathione hydrolase FrmB
LLSLNAQNQYNLTIIEPAFGIAPWYANNPGDPSVHYETFMAHDLVPWVQKNFGGAATPAGGGQNWLIGFSKSGFGAQDLLFKYPQLFSLAASWDFPADMDSYSGDTAAGIAFGSSSETAYGTDANFQANYRLTPGFLAAHKAPFLSSNRIWVGGYDVFGADMTDYDALLSSAGIPHSTQTPQLMAHGWDSAWMQEALSVLRQDSAALRSGS